MNAVNNKWLGIGLIACVLLVAILIIPSLVSWPTIPAGGWLIASLLGAAAILVGSEILIKKQALTGFGEKAARTAFIFGALVIVGVGIYQILPTGAPQAAGQQPTWFENVFDRFGWFGMLAGAVIALVLAFGVKQYFGIAGNGSAYFLMGVVGLIVFFGILYLAGTLIAPYQTQVLLDAAKVSIEQGAEGLTTTTSPYGHRAIDWEKFVGIDWGTVGGIAFACFLVFVFLQQYFGKNKIVVTTAAIVASIAFLILSYHFATKWEVTNNIIQGAADYNPALGETKSLSFSRSVSGEVKSIIGIGPYDEIALFLPNNGCGVEIATTSHFHDRFDGRDWYDPYHIVEKTGGGSNQLRIYSLNPAMKAGLRNEDATLDVDVRLACSQ